MWVRATAFSVGEDQGYYDRKVCDVSLRASPYLCLAIIPCDCCTITARQRYGLVGEASEMCVCVMCDICMYVEGTFLSMANFQ